MSDTFTASNGVRVTRRGESVRLSCEFMANRIATFDDLNMQDLDALREFFQHERDKELGRWRWPEKPDYVVYPKERSTSGKRMVRVVSEAHGYGCDYCEGDRDGNEQRLAASAYFAAHPEPKPEWHDAKPGEVWAITAGSHPDEFAVQVTTELVFGTHDGDLISTKDEGIVSARRIFPEVPSE